MDRTDHIVEPHEVSSPDNAKDECAPECTDESFNGFFRRELDQRGTTEGDTPDVGKHIVANDQRGRDKEPDQSLKDIIDDEVAAKRFRPRSCSGATFLPGHHDQEQTHMNPAKEAKLLLQITPLKR